MLPKHECRKCGHVWSPRIEGRPKNCPNCKSPKWWEERVRPVKEKR